MINKVNLLNAKENLSFNGKNHISKKSIKFIVERAVGGVQLPDSFYAKLSPKETVAGVVNLLKNASKSFIKEQTELSDLNNKWWTLVLPPKIHYPKILRRKIYERANARATKIRPQLNERLEDDYKIIDKALLEDNIISSKKYPTKVKSLWMLYERTANNSKSSFDDRMKAGDLFKKYHKNYVNRLVKMIQEELKK